MVKVLHWPPVRPAASIDYKLDNVTQALEGLGNPQNRLKNVVHVAGTNGKGSTVAFLRSIVQSAGYTCNAYMSPHVNEVNERFFIRNKQISDGDLLALMQKTKNALSAIGGGFEESLSYFECLAVAAFIAFADSEADCNIIEVGLGGKLDATNVMAQKAISIITPISIDHTAILGSSIEEISHNKAAITYKSRFSIISEQPSPEAAAILSEYEANSRPPHAAGNQGQSAGNQCKSVGNQCNASGNQCKSAGSQGNASGSQGQSVGNQCKSKFLWFSKHYLSSPTKGAPQANIKNSHPANVECPHTKEALTHSAKQEGQAHHSQASPNDKGPQITHGQHFEYYASRIVEPAGERSVYASPQGHSSSAASHSGAPLISLGCFTSALRGGHQAVNASCAITASILLSRYFGLKNINGQAIYNGLQSATNIARMEQVSLLPLKPWCKADINPEEITTFVDVAHNEASLHAALTEALSGNSHTTSCKLSAHTASYKLGAHTASYKLGAHTASCKLGAHTTSYKLGVIINLLERKPLPEAARGIASAIKAYSRHLAAVESSTAGLEKVQIQVYCPQINCEFPFHRPQALCDELARQGINNAQAFFSLQGACVAAINDSCDKLLITGSFHVAEALYSIISPPPSTGRIPPPPPSPDMRVPPPSPDVRVITSARAIITRGPSILLVRARGSSSWHVPGGWLDGFESLAECCKREVYEELGLKVEVGKMLYVSEYRVLAQNSAFHENVHKIEHFFHCKLEEGAQLNPTWKDEDAGYIEEAKFVEMPQLSTASILPKWLEKANIAADIQSANSQINNVPRYIQ